MDWIIGLPVEKVYLVAGNHDAFLKELLRLRRLNFYFYRPIN